MRSSCPLWLSFFYRTTDANIGDCINCWKFLSSALNFTTSLLVSLSTVVPSIAAFSVGLASIFLNRMPAFRTEERVEAVTLSDGENVQVEIHAMIKVNGVARAQKLLLHGVKFAEFGGAAQS